MKTALQLGDDLIHYLAPAGLPPNLVLLHGFGGSVRHFEPLLAELGRAATPLAFDLPGCGRSTGVAPANVGSMVSCVIDVLDALAPEAPPFVLLGHSLGGLVAAEVALARPERVRSLVLVASSPRMRLHPEVRRQAMTGCWDDEFLRGSFGPQACAEHVRWVSEDLRALRLPRGTDAAGFWAGHDVCARLHEIEVDTLVIVPSDDAVVSPRNGELWRRGIRHARLVEVSDTGHYVQLEDPRAVAELVRERLPCGAPSATESSPTFRERAYRAALRP